jgi:EF hand domain-containing protein
MNKLAIVAAAALAATTFGLSGAFAQTNNDDAFQKADANKDMSVSMEEAMGVYPTLTQDIFTKADANADGKLDNAEFAALVGLSANLGGDNGGSSSAADTSSSSSAQ